MERRVAYAAALVMFFAMMFWTCASCLESTLTEAMYRAHALDPQNPQATVAKQALAQCLTV